MKKLLNSLLVFTLLFNPLNSVFGHGGAENQHIHLINKKYKLYKQSQSDLEGYNQQIGGEEYIYQSLREMHKEAMIARATTGKFGFDFMTSKVPDNHSGDQVTFFFYSNVDLNNREPFDIRINDSPFLSFQANEDGTFKVLNNPGNGNLQYILVERDVHGDGVGAFRLTVPKTSAPNGKKVKVSVIGHQKSSNSWFMLFKMPDAHSYLTITAQHEVAFQFRNFNDLILIDAPISFAGKTIELISDDSKSKKVTFALQGELAKANVKMDAPLKYFKIIFNKDFYQIDIENSSKEINLVEVIGDFTYSAHSHGDSEWSMSFNKLYRPEHYQAFAPFLDKTYANGYVSVMNSSHQDIAWVERPEICIILRDTLLLTPVLKDALVREDYGFDVEDALMLREYLERHPDATDKISQLLKRNVLSIGATYNCPYEDMYSGEDLVRQLYTGKKWLKKTFDGYDSKVYWNVDVPGKTLQMPQILKKAGVDYMVISRHSKGFFYWASPDESTVFTYSPGHYGNDYFNLNQGDISSKLKYSAEQVVWWGQFSEEKTQYTPLLSSMDMLPAIDYSDMIQAWNSREFIKEPDHSKNSIYLPDMELMTIDEYMPFAEKSIDLVDTVMGERPNVWVYIHGPSHHNALTASREASKLLTAAEKFSTVSYLLDKTKMPYPTNALDQAWQDKIYPDHGWGGKDGDITDALFEAKFVSAREQAKQLLDRAITFVASRVNTEDNEGMPLVVFNSLSWEREDPVTFELNLPKGTSQYVSIFDDQGKELASQLSEVQMFNDSSIKYAKLTFIADKVPPMGYKTYYLRYSTPKTNVKNTLAKVDSYENDYYKLIFNNGLEQVYDKELGKNLFKTDKFKIGEIFTLESFGNGAGEFGDIQQPVMKDFDKMSNHHPKVEMIENGTVYTTYRIEQPILHAVAQQNITIYHQLKRVQFDNKIRNWDGTMYREFRTAYPVNIENAAITYDVPFGEVQVGRDEIRTAGERYTPLCKDVHPRAMMDWMSASNEDMVVTVSSSVSAFDWIDPTKDTNQALLQHLLLASRKSCHWEGNLYSQQGSHSYSHIFTSRGSNDASGSLIAEQYNEPLVAVLNPDKSSKANLATEQSFFSIIGKDIIVSAVKKADDSDNIIMRMYNRNKESTIVSFESYFNFDGIYQTNIIEENPKEIKKLEVGKYAIETVELDLEK